MARIGREQKPAGTVAAEIPGQIGFQRLRRFVLLASVAVLLVPLTVMVAFGYQFDKAIRSDAMKPIARITSHIAQSLEWFFAERLSILDYTVRGRSAESLRDSAELERVLHKIRASFPHGAFADLGLIDPNGDQIAYSGRFPLEGLNYRDQDWYQDVIQNGTCISDVFLGYRRLPHFAVARTFGGSVEVDNVLRTTIDAETLRDFMATSEASHAGDVFLINREGILQTLSHTYGKALEPCTLPVPPPIPSSDVFETTGASGEPIIVGYAYIKGTPYVLIVIERPEDVVGKWFGLRNELVAALSLSSIVVLGVILWGSNQFVNRLREANQRRTALLHEIEYTNRMASIGRLAAGVAHEINNPLAIIGEKAGLLRDLVTQQEGSEERERYVGLLDGVLGSVKRCSAITHRLLGFAKHMDVKNDTIELGHLLREVYGFLEKEAAYRRLDVQFDIPEDVPTIASDRGQLQQVFLNLLNNAIVAVREEGHIRVTVRSQPEDRVSITVADDGVGIPAENLPKIFEPFFTTKRKEGIGLGLSITYGIVRKLGGDIRVESEIDRGAKFTVTLPTRAEG
ncbi:MAG: ATP-binding protein [Planctomycetota bacterium]